MKKITLLIIFLFAIDFGYGQTTLAAGDIVITGFNSDAPDQFTFVLLEDVLASTQIKFTDNGWQNTGSFRANEGTLIWTADTDLSCGTEITIIDGSPFYASVGSVTDSSQFNLATSGDQILAYQGPDATPTFIYAVTFDDTLWLDAVSSQTTALPTGLTDMVNAVALSETDNANYNCTVVTGKYAILAAVSSDISNWTLSNSPLTLGGCTYTCDPCLTTVTWNGSTWSNGSGPDINTTAIIDGSFNTQTNGGSFSACNLVVNSSGTLPEYTLIIADGDHIQVQNNIIANGNITVQPQGAVVQIDDGALVLGSGTMTVTKRTAPANNWYEYTYWSSPVSGADINNGLAESDVNRRFRFDASNFEDSTMEVGNNNASDPGQDDIDDNKNDWQQVGGATLMVPGVGYASTHEESVFAGPGSPPYQFDYTFQGRFNNGIITVPVVRNDGSTLDENWNFIGNPYPSPISISDFLAVNMFDATTNPTGTLEGTIYFWSQNTAPSSSANGNEQLNFALSDYARFNGVMGVRGGDPTVPNGFIPSGQGFFVSFAQARPSSTGNVIFNNSMRSIAHDNSQFFKNTKSKKGVSTNNNDNKLWIDLTSDNGVFNQIGIGYVDGATHAYDGSFYDTHKIVAPKTFAALYSTIENSNKKFAIQGKAPSDLTENEIINLGFKTTIDVATLYTLSINKLKGDFLNNNPVYLIDNLLNKTHDLRVCDYTFTSEVGEFNSRFQIAFSDKALSTNDFGLNNNALKIIELDNDFVNFKLSDNLKIKTVTIFDLLGRQLYNLKGTNSSETYKLSNLKNTVFIAKVELLNGAIITKKAIKK
ncbi:hypothetical protein [Gelatiniphilus marinus]|uniref:T9SS type A sorting domain-containing protein n=1 Tax=Gelatiniphilus marinus TaxID=1759464 RepID=A0ABW5JWH1_9FLAO